MADLSKEYKKIIKQIDERFPNMEERMFIKDRISEVTLMYLDIIDRLTSIAEMRLDELETKMSTMHDTVEEIGNDMYDENAFDFEIVCPYCNHEFVTDVDVEEKTEIECPECHNIIELDWGAEEEEDTLPQETLQEESPSMLPEEPEKEEPKDEDDM